ncbi:uncharacterized protein PRCAT00002682001 [Priceomyces carsonii]|uniref:uncharacterized protein n=1 Tax=Priceomyces carsonii TaxID=28549 RepID=UPI002ED7C6C0|nr:unnamed protein product [Priceomyces carsonii]
MHPQLDRNRFQPCEKLMDALEDCHKQEYVKQVLGMCNFEKNELSKCLHYTRVEDSKDRIRRSREKQKIFEAKRKQNEEEIYGKNNYLKEIVDRDAQKLSEKSK